MIKTSSLIVFLGLIFSVVFTWPYALNLKSFYYDRGDYPVSASILSYNEQALKSGKIFDSKTYFQGNEFYPQPSTLIYFDFRLVPSLIYSPLFWITKDLILSINLTLFLSFVFSFIASFYTINYFVKNKLASCIGAVVYTFNPLTLSRFPEHFDLFHKYFLPLVFLFAYKFFKSPNLKDAFYFYLTFTANAFAAISYQIFALITLPFFVSPFIVKNILQENVLYFVKILKYSLVFIIFLPVFLYFDSHYLSFSKDENISRPLETNTFFSARLIDYISSGKNNWLYGGFVKNLDQYRSPKDVKGNFNYQEHTLFLNIIPMFLFGLAMIYFITKKPFKRYLIPFIILLILSFILTLGPFYLGWNGNSGNIKLPFYYLYQITPFLKANRTPDRFQFIFYVPFALIISFGTKWLLEFCRKSYLAIAASVIILTGLFIENYYPDGAIYSYQERSSIIPKINKINSSKENLNFLENKNTLHIPVRTLDWNSGLDSLYLNWAAITKERIVNGNVASYIPKEQITLLADLSGKLDERILKKLISIGVDYVVIHWDLLGDEKEYYEKNKEFYYKTSVLNQDNIMVLDLKKYPYEINKCKFEEDIEKNIKRAMLPSNIQFIYLLVLKNKSDCYMSSIYQDKYKSLKFNNSDFYNNPKESTLYFKMPVVIEPFEEVVLSELNNDLKIEQQ